MSLFNEVLVGRYNSVLHRLMSMKEGAPAPQLSSEISAVIPLEVDRPEWAFLGGEYLYSAPAMLAASPGNFTSVGLSNLQNSTSVGVLTAILVNNENAAAASFNWKNAGTGIGGTFRAFSRDSRAFFAGPSQRANILLGSVTEAAATGNLLGRVTLPPGGSAYIPVSYIIGPGAGGVNSQFRVEGAVVNIIVSATFFWRERALEPSENR